MSVADLDKLRLELTSEGYSYDIYPIQSVDPDQTKNATSISVPGQAAENNILLGISGMGRDIQISFYLYDDGTDRANGTYTSTVTTVAEQHTYLRDEIHEPSFSAKWELTDLTGSLFAGLPVFVENYSVSGLLSDDSPKWKSATLRLRVGSSI